MREVAAEICNKYLSSAPVISMRVSRDAAHRVASRRVGDEKHRNRDSYMRCKSIPIVFA